MKIRIGYELIYDCPQPTPMILTLSVHYSRVSDIIVPDHLIADPPVPLTAYRDSYGNWCSRIVAPKGQVRLSTDALVRDTGLLDVVVPSARQTPVEELADETLLFLLGSRYCETDRLSETAWQLFGQTPTGWARVQAICDYVHRAGWRWCRSQLVRRCRLIRERFGLATTSLIALPPDDALDRAGQLLRGTVDGLVHGRGLVRHGDRLAAFETGFHHTLLVVPAAPVAVLVAEMDLHARDAIADSTQRLLHDATGPRGQALLPFDMTIGIDLDLHGVFLFLFQSWFVRTNDTGAATRASRTRAPYVRADRPVLARSQAPAGTRRAPRASSTMVRHFFCMCVAELTEIRRARTFMSVREIHTPRWVMAQFIDRTDP
jgi:hypothetical protein